MKNKFQTKKIVTVSFAHLFHDIYSAFLAPMLPLLITKLGISLSMAGLLDVVRRIPALFNPLIGLMADRICFKYFIIITPAITAISMSLLGIAPSYFVLFVLLFVSGFSSTLFHVPAPVVIKRLSGDRTATGMSFFMFGGEMARTLGPLIIVGAISVWGLEGSFRVMPLGLLATFILFFKLKDISPANDNVGNNRKKGTRETLRDLVPFFTFIIGFQFFRAGMKSALTLYLPTYLTGNGYSFWLAGISLSVLQLAGAGGTFGTGFISDRITPRNTLLITAVASPVVMWMFLQANEVMILPILILMGFLLFAPGPVILALVQDTNTEYPAFVNGIYMTINIGINSIMILMIGILGDSIGLDTTFMIFAGLAIFSIPFIFILPGRKMV